MVTFAGLWDEEKSCCSTSDHCPTNSAGGIHNAHQGQEEDDVCRTQEPWGVTGKTDMGKGKPCVSYTVQGVNCTY